MNVSSVMKWGNQQRELFRNNGSISHLRNELSLSSDKSSFLRLLSEDLELGNGQENVFNYFKNKNNQFIGGVFKCSYHPGLLFELANIEDIDATIDFDSIQETPIRTIKIKNGTEGIANPQVVALFPENFLNHAVKDDDIIFYFVDKFSKRHISYTRNVIEKFTVNHPFKEILKDGEVELEQYVTNWVNLHEGAHRTGPLPIPKFLPEKSSSITAGIEELRVDLISMLYCLNKSSSKSDSYYKTFLLILAERLLGYPFFRDIDKNFDAHSSCIFLDHLVNDGLVSLKDAKIVFKENFNVGIKSLLQKIEKLESDASKYNTLLERKTLLKSSANQWLEEAHQTIQFLKKLRGIL